METEEKVKKIQHTQARRSIINALRALSDYEWQMQAWVDANYKHALSDSIWYYGLDTLIESYDFDEYEEAYKQIGQTLYDREEVAALQNYCEFVLELVNETIGVNKADAVYYMHADWERVVRGALEVRILMAKKNIANEFWREFDEDVNDVYEEDGHQFMDQDKQFIATDVNAYMAKYRSQQHFITNNK